MNLEIHTRRQRSAADATCRRCRWDEAGGWLGVPHPPSHTCAGLESAGQLASRTRQLRLQRINRDTNQRTR